MWSLILVLFVLLKFGPTATFIGTACGAILGALIGSFMGATAGTLIFVLTLLFVAFVTGEAVKEIV